MQPKLTISLLALAAVLLVAGAGWLGERRGSMAPEPYDREWPTETGERLPDATLTDYAGGTVRLSDFAGRPLVVNSWAAWCLFCSRELSDLAAVQKEFSGAGAGGGAVFVAINRAETVEVAQGFTDELGISQALMFLLDPSDAFYQAIGGFSMPETLFVNPDGTVQFHKRGPLTQEEIRERAQELVR